MAITSNISSHSIDIDIKILIMTKRITLLRKLKRKSFLYYQEKKIAAILLLILYV